MRHFSYALNRLLNPLAPFMAVRMGRSGAYSDRETVRGYGVSAISPKGTTVTGGYENSALAPSSAVDARKQELSALSP